MDLNKIVNGCKSAEPDYIIAIDYYTTRRDGLIQACKQ